MSTHNKTQSNVMQFLTGKSHAAPPKITVPIMESPKYPTLNSTKTSVVSTPTLTLRISTTTPPKLNYPPASVPTASVPTASVPTASVPTASVPTASVPTASVPTASVPAASVPTASVPAASVPAASVPTVSVPTASVPTVSVPTVSVPTVSVPTASVPTGSVPTKYPVVPKSPYSSIIIPKSPIITTVQKSPYLPTVNPITPKSPYLPTVNPITPKSPYLPSVNPITPKSPYLPPTNPVTPMSPVLNIVKKSPYPPTASPVTPKSPVVISIPRSPYLPTANPVIPKSPVVISIPRSPYLPTASPITPKKSPMVTSMPRSPYRPTAQFVGPRSPLALIIPRVMSPKGFVRSEMPSPRSSPEIPLSEEIDLWMPPIIAYPARVTVGSVTPIGTIAMVPTATTRIKNTSFYKVEKKVEEHDPLITATIYFDYTKKEDRPHSFVSDKMRHITESTLILQKQYQNTLKPCVQVRGFVSAVDFDKYLSIYENNQVFYQDRLDDQGISLEEIKIALSTLEYWFILIIEPKPKHAEDIGEWKLREINKIINGYSGYCDPVLHKYITQAPREILIEVGKYHRSINL